MGNLENWAGAALIALLVGAAGHLDPVEDRGWEHAQAAAILDAQREARAQAAMERAAYLACHDIGGPNVLATLNPDGSWSCTSKRGLRFAAAW